MSYKALVIDDDPAVFDSVADILTSLGHNHDWARSQEEARNFAKANEYSYVLLDLEIPARSRGSTPRIQNSVNLLDEISGTGGREAVPIIVMTGCTARKSEMAAEMMRLGAFMAKKGVVDFINKPFPSTGRTLDRVIKKNIARIAPAKSPEPAVVPPKPKKVQPFKGGELVFYPDRVELCGVKILADSGLGHCRRMLELLRRKNRSGRFVRMGGEELAKTIGEEINTGIIIGTITGCAKTIRSNIKRRLLRELNIECTDDDVLVRDDQGYHLDERIEVRESTDGHGTSNDTGIMGHDPDVPENISDDTANDTADDTVNDTADDTVAAINERQNWALAQVAKGAKLRRNILENKFDVSPVTAKRDFSELVKRGLLEYVRKPRPGFYQQKS